MPEPLYVRCEGSDHAVHRFTRGSTSGGHFYGTCAMCGSWVRSRANGIARPHDREDVMAMFERGDFDSIPAADDDPAGM